MSAPGDSLPDVRDSRTPVRPLWMTVPREAQIESRMRNRIHGFPSRSREGRGREG